MRVRNWVLIAVAFLTLTLGLTGCAARVARSPKDTPVPTKTLRPTFTATVPKPTLTPSPTAAVSDSAAQPAGDQASAAPTAEPPTATPEPTAEPSPTSAPAAFTVSSASINVRSGPSTLFPVIGRLTNGQTFPITGKNDDGSWWQFDYNGKTGWVIGSNVAVTSADTVQVAQNIPAAPPTARPQPTARPAAPKPAAPAQPQPTSPPAAAASRYNVAGTTLLPNTNEIVTVYCLTFKGSAPRPGTIRVSGPSGTVEKAFPGQGSWYLQFPISDGCKVELPASNGTFTAVLIDGGQPVSDPFTFTVNGSANRTAIIGWSEK